MDNGKYQAQFAELYQVKLLVVRHSFHMNWTPTCLEGKKIIATGQRL